MLVLRDNGRPRGSSGEKGLSFLFKKGRRTLLTGAKMRSKKVE